MSSLRKRKGHPEFHGMGNMTYSPQDDGNDDRDTLYRALFIQAHEADIIRGPHARIAATSLEVANASGVLPTDRQRSPPLTVGEALIQWAGTSCTQPVDQDGTVEPRRDGIWVDRYDARLLLDTVPVVSVAEAANACPGSPGGWSDLPSDSEDTFFFSPEEAEDYHRDKKRRYLEKAREERLQARQAEDDETVEEVWGGSDEEPNETQRELMQRTAMHISSSLNSAQLEMRILANHGNDERFAFLRGRWKRAWDNLKRNSHCQKPNHPQAPPTAGLGALASYGDSSGESGDEGGSDKGKTSSDADITEAVKEARRTRAKEWATRRRGLRGSS